MGLERTITMVFRLQTSVPYPKIMPTGVANRHVARRTPFFKGTVHIYRSLESSDLSHLLFLEVRHTFLVKFIIIDGCKARVNVVTGRYLSWHLRVIFCAINYVKLVVHYSIDCLPNVQWRVIHLSLRWQYLSFTSGVGVNESIKLKSWKILSSPQFYTVKLHREESQLNHTRGSVETPLCAIWPCKTEANSPMEAEQSHGKWTVLLLESFFVGFFYLQSFKLFWLCLLNICTK